MVESFESSLVSAGSLRNRNNSFSSLSEVDEGESSSESHFSTTPLRLARSNEPPAHWTPPLHTVNTPLATVLSSHSSPSLSVSPFLPIATPIVLTPERVGSVAQNNHHHSNNESYSFQKTFHKPTGQAMASTNTNATRKETTKTSSKTVTPPDSPTLGDAVFSPPAMPTGASQSKPPPSSSPTVPYVSLHRGLQRKQALTSIDAWNRLTLTLHGRDKVTKILQYLTRLYVWWLKSGGNSNKQVAQWKHVQQVLTLARKAYRLGRGVGETPKMVETVRRAMKTMSGPSMLQAVKSAGLWGFWMHDHMAFLTALGVLRKDNKRLPEWSKWAIRSYWVSAVAGLVLNWRAYWDHRRSVLGPLLTERTALGDADARGTDEQLLQQRSEQEEQKQFTLLLALVKSVCDVLVHSNNGGVDLWQRYRGRKMHEGLHCVLGVTSAATVVYNNYPDYTP